MALSARYRTLGPRITGLGKHLLPRKTALGLYSPRQHDRIRGYVVLAHAEIEYCLEKLAEEAVVAALAGFLADGRVRSCLQSLLTAFPANQRPVPWGTWTQRRRIQWCVRIYRQTILPRNHGASSKHVLNLVRPLGITQSQLDTTWLAAADTLFSKRGAMAHTAVSVQTDPNPEDERRAVRAVAAGLGDLDRLLAQVTS